MGCRPSKQATSKVRAADHKEGPRCLCSPKKSRKNHKCSSGSSNSRRNSGGSARASVKKHFSNSHMPCSSKSTDLDFPAFSTTSAVYRTSASKTSKITLRLSCDGSTLEIEQCDYDLEKVRGQSEPKPRPWNSAPNLTRLRNSKSRLFRDSYMPIQHSTSGWSPNVISVSGSRGGLIRVPVQVSTPDESISSAGNISSHQYSVISPCANNNSYRHKGSIGHALESSTFPAKTFGKTSLSRSQTSSTFSSGDERRPLLLDILKESHKKSAMEGNVNKAASSISVKTVDKNECRTNSSLDNMINELECSTEVAHQATSGPDSLRPCSLGVKVIDSHNTMNSETSDCQAENCMFEQYISSECSGFTQIPVKFISSLMPSQGQELAGALPRGDYSLTAPRPDVYYLHTRETDIINNCQAPNSICLNLPSASKHLTAIGSVASTQNENSRKGPHGLSLSDPTSDREDWRRTATYRWSGSPDRISHVYYLSTCADSSVDPHPVLAHKKRWSDVSSNCLLQPTDRSRVPVLTAGYYDMTVCSDRGYTPYLKGPALGGTISHVDSTDNISMSATDNNRQLLGGTIVVDNSGVAAPKVTNSCRLMHNIGCRGYESGIKGHLRPLSAMDVVDGAVKESQTTVQQKERLGEAESGCMQGIVASSYSQMTALDNALVMQQTTREEKLSTESASDRMTEESRHRGIRQLSEYGSERETEDSKARSIKQLLVLKCGNGNNRNKGIKELSEFKSDRGTKESRHRCIRQLPECGSERETEESRNRGMNRVDSTTRIMAEWAELADQNGSIGSDLHTNGAITRPRSFVNGKSNGRTVASQPIDEDQWAGVLESMPHLTGSHVVTVSSCFNDMRAGEEAWRELETEERHDQEGVSEDAGYLMSLLCPPCDTLVSSLNSSSAFSFDFEHSDEADLTCTSVSDTSDNEESPLYYSSLAEPIGFHAKISGHGELDSGSDNNITETRLTSIPRVRETIVCRRLALMDTYADAANKCPDDMQPCRALTEEGQARTDGEYLRERVSKSLGSVHQTDVIPFAADWGSLLWNETNSIMRTSNVIHGDSPRNRKDNEKENRGDTTLLSGIWTRDNLCGTSTTGKHVRRNDCQEIEVERDPTCTAHDCPLVDINLLPRVRSFDCNFVQKTRHSQSDSHQSSENHENQQTRDKSFTAQALIEGTTSDQSPPNTRHRQSRHRSADPCDVTQLGSFDAQNSTLNPLCCVTDTLKKSFDTNRPEIHQHTTCLLEHQAYICSPENGTCKSSVSGQLHDFSGRTAVKGEMAGNFGHRRDKENMAGGRFSKLLLSLHPSTELVCDSGRAEVTSCSVSSSGACLYARPVISTDCPSSNVLIATHSVLRAVDVGGSKLSSSQTVASGRDSKFLFLEQTDQISDRMQPLTDQMWTSQRAETELKNNAVQQAIRIDSRDRLVISDLRDRPTSVNIYCGNQTNNTYQENQGPADEITDAPQHQKRQFHIPENVYRDWISGHGTVLGSVSPDLATEGCLARDLIQSTMTSDISLDVSSENADKWQVAHTHRVSRNNVLSLVRYFEKVPYNRHGTKQ